MLSLALVLIVGLGSVGLYLTTYVYPEIHRKTDIWWSGTGLFYASILLMYRRPFGLLLGHTASVVLLGWLSYQALQRRWAMVKANPPKPIEGTWAAHARQVSDQVLAKIAGVDWQGLWERLGTQANDGTSEKSILPLAIKQRLDLSGWGEKLKGLISGKEGGNGQEIVGQEVVGQEVAQAKVPTVQTTEASPPVSDPPAAPPTKTTVDTTIQAASVSEFADPAEAQIPPAADPAVENQAIKAVDLPTPSTFMSPERLVEPDEESPTTLQEEPAVKDPLSEQPDTQKAELEAELDQVISDLSPQNQDAPQNLPQPPDPLG